MLSNNKILPVALIAALLGGSVGAFVMRPSKTTDTLTSPAVNTANIAPAHSLTTPSSQQLAANTPQSTPDTTATLSNEQTAYRDGFNEGFRAAQSNNQVVPSERSVRTATTNRVVYRPARTRYARSASPRQVYYDYEPRRRSFWQKHRDKLTVAMGTGAGAAIGGLIGGKKGALIGALSGAGGSALYTYKLRKRDRRY